MENVVLDRDENLARVEVATLAIIFVVTVIGNTTVLLALWTRRKYAGRKKLSRMYFFILHLSVADLITAFLSVLPQLGWDVTYRLVSIKLIGNSTATISIFNVRRWRKRWRTTLFPYYANLSRLAFPVIRLRNCGTNELLPMRYLRFWFRRGTAGMFDIFCM